MNEILAALKTGVEAIYTLQETLAAVFPRTTGTASSATVGTATALPALPAGYLDVLHPDGTTVRVPYYNV